jgi:hypothetical protein
VKYFKPSAVVKSMIAVLASPGVAYAVVADMLLTGRIWRFDSFVSFVYSRIGNALVRKESGDAFQ